MDSGPSIPHLQTLFTLRQHSYSGPGSTGRTGQKRYSGLSHSWRLRTVRLHCPLLNFLYLTNLLLLANKSWGSEPLCKAKVCIAMKNELGKWLMDIAKYIMTAVILTSIFGEFSQKWIVYVGGSLTIACTLGWGLYLLKDNNDNKKRIR